MTRAETAATAQAIMDSLSAPATFAGFAFCVHPGETAQERAARHDPIAPPGYAPTLARLADDEPPAIEAEAWTYDPDRFCPACGRRGKWILRAARLEIHNVAGLRFLEDMRPAPPQGELF